MIYEIKLHPNVEKFLSKLDGDLRERLKNRLRKLGEDPFKHLEHYEGDSCHKFRLGDYRALVDVDKVRSIVFIRVLDHRSRIYDKK